MRPINPFASLIAVLLVAAPLTGCVGEELDINNEEPEVQSEAEALLRQQIEAHVAAYGGTQISPYEIAWDDGVIMTFPYPGEEHARARSAAAEEIQVDSERAREVTGADSAERHADTPLPFVGGCPTVVFGNDSYCFYEHKNYGGRRLTWSDSSASRKSFNGYGFRNKVSSWVNGGALVIRVGDDRAGTLWEEYDHSSSKYVGDRLNDRSDYFTATSR